MLFRSTHTHTQRHTHTKTHTHRPDEGKITRKKDGEINCKLRKMRKMREKREVNSEIKGNMLTVVTEICGGHSENPQKPLLTQSGTGL